MQNWEEVQLAVAALRLRLGAALPSRPDAAIILGTGLSGLVERMEDTVSVPYADLPGFPVSTVASHAGAFVLGRLGGRTVLVQQGRCHLYEGFGPDKVCMGVRVMAGLGADTLILTNAAGALDPQFDAVWDARSARVRPAVGGRSSNVHGRPAPFKGNTA